MTDGSVVVDVNFNISQAEKKLAKLKQDIENAEKSLSEKRSVAYLTYGSGQRACMATVLDAYTKRLLAYDVGEPLKIDFVLNAVNRLIEEHGVSLQAETLINSDQGSHYTSLKFIQIIRDNNLRQSIGRPTVGIMRRRRASLGI